MSRTCTTSGGVPAGDEGAAGRGPAARRLPDRHRQDDGGKPGRAAGIWRRMQDVVRPLDNPLRTTGPLDGAARQPGARGGGGKNLRPEGDPLHRPGAGVRLGGSCHARRCSTTEIKPGDVVVIRYEGPKGGPGMREMLSVTAIVIGKGLGESIAPHHRRPLLRRHPRLRRRPRRPRGAGRRPHRAAARRRHGHHRQRNRRAVRGPVRRGAAAPGGGLAGAAAQVHPRRAGQVRPLRVVGGRAR